MNVRNGQEFGNARCEHESNYLALSGGRSYCEVLKAWVNCRETGHCLADQKEMQMKMELKQ